MSMASDNRILQKSRPQTSVLDFDRGTLLGLIRENLADKDIHAAYVFGSFARNESHLWSDIDLIIVKDSSLPFVERPREFFDLLDLGIPMDILVYTPAEYAKIQREEGGFWKEIHSQLIQIV